MALYLSEVPSLPYLCDSFPPNFQEFLSPEWTTLFAEENVTLLSLTTQLLFNLHQRAKKRGISVPLSLPKRVLFQASFCITKTARYTGS